MTATLRLVSPRFLSTPSGWRATFPALPPWVLPLYFYPRPPGGGRQGFYYRELGLYAISIHALRVEGDAGPRRKETTMTQFLSTPSGWRATLYKGAGRGEEKFLSTPSGWRATGSQTPSSGTTSISIHALRVEGDAGQSCTAPAARDFYPRPPGGGRPSSRSSGWTSRNFYPRPPGGGRPPESDKIYVILSISIHALRVEGDSPRPLDP